MKKAITWIALLAVTIFPLVAQDKVADNVKKSISRAEVENQLGFLASNDLKGRDTGSPEIEIAAQYIASFFKQQGLKPIGPDGYFQKVELTSQKPPTELEFVLDGTPFKLGDDLLLYGGQALSAEAPVVFAGYGLDDDLAKADVRGKIVVVLAGTPAEGNFNKAFMEDAKAKMRKAKELGALAIVEIVALPSLPFPALVNYLSRTRMRLKESQTSIPHIWMRNSDNAALNKLKETRAGQGKLTIKVDPPIDIVGKNVLGVIEGTDKELKKQYVVVSAHYDHVGIGRKDANQDSIYNGARDNAIGTVGIMQTAKYLSRNRPKRSVLFIALTAEEKGLLGSAWYAEHPVLPLHDVVFNFNCDGAGYNDTSITTVIGLHRTNVEPLLSKASEAFGLKVTDDPVPEQNLFERSDNYNFAVKGIPAIDFSPGITGFDQELGKYYHQPADEVGSLDFTYLVKFFGAFVYSNVLIANLEETPAWTAGDKFESAAKKLYSR